MGTTILDAKGILVDLDGTVLDTTDAYLCAAEMAFRDVGLEMPEETKVLEIPKLLEQRLPITNVVKVNVQRFLDVFLKSFYIIASSKTKPIPGVDRALGSLSRKAKLAIITMRFMPIESICQELGRFDLAKHFSYVVTALDTSRPKPSPEALIKAAEALDVQVCDCMIVGDSVSDILAGKAASIKTVAVLSGLFSHEELAMVRPDLIIRDISDLPRYMK